jgi:hypothetical protein
MEHRVDHSGWKQFLKRWTEDWLADNPSFAAELPNGWAGRPPATEEQLAALEDKLEVRLPPSFREFLQVSNGWGYTINFVEAIRGTADLGWLRDLDPLWVEIYDDLDDDGEDEAAILRRALLISTDADGGCLFLDPGDVNEDGEWAAYELFSWRAMGPERHDSFSALMYDCFAGFHSLYRPQSATQREWDVKIEQARRAALAGEVHEALPVLREAQRFGRDRAGVLLFQLETLLGHESSQLVHHPLSGGAVKVDTWDLDASLVSAEFLPVLHAEHQRTDHWARQSSFTHLRKYGTEPVKKLVADYQAKASDPAFRVTLGNPEFDSAVRAAITDPDTAWPQLRDAMAMWRPISEDHIAPVVLMADPRIAKLITPERGRELLAMRRG